MHNVFGQIFVVVVIMLSFCMSWVMAERAIPKTQHDTNMTFLPHLVGGNTITDTINHEWHFWPIILTKTLHPSSLWNCIFNSVFTTVTVHVFLSSSGWKNIDGMWILIYWCCLTIGDHVLFFLDCCQFKKQPEKIGQDILFFFNDLMSSSDIRTWRGKKKKTRHK